MQKLKGNKDLLKIAAIILVFAAVFLWIKVYPTIEDSLIENPDELEITRIIPIENGQYAEQWYNGNNLTDDLYTAIKELLVPLTTTRTFECDGVVGGAIIGDSSLNDSKYYIYVMDGDLEKTILLGKENTCTIRGKGVRSINDSESIIADLDALLDAA